MPVTAQDIEESAARLEQLEIPEMTDEQLAQVAVLLDSPPAGTDHSS